MSKNNKFTSHVTSALALTLAAASLISCSGKDVKTTNAASTTTALVTTAPSTLPSTTSPSTDVDLSSLLFPELSGSDPLPLGEFVYDDYLKFLKVGTLSSVVLYEKDIEEEYNEYVSEILAEYQTYTEASADTAAANGDRVTIYYTGSGAVEGESFSDSTMQGMTNEGAESGTPFVLGSNSFVGPYTSLDDPSKNARGFEEQLIGAKAGDMLTVTVRFSDGYGLAELRGKLIDFAVRVTKVETADPAPTLTDEIVKKHTDGEYEKIDDFKSFLVSQYKGQAAYDAVSKLVEVETYPSDAVDEQIAEYKKSYLEYMNKKEEDLTADKLKELDEDARSSVENYIGQRLVWNYLFGVYEIKLTKDEFIMMTTKNYKQYATYYSYYYGIKDVAGFVEYFGQSNLVSQFMQQKLLPVLAERVTWSADAPETTD